jgi:hypothetical protein
MGTCKYAYCLLLLLWFPSFLSAQYLNVLDSLLYNDTSSVMRKVLADPDKYRLQIIYSQTDYSGKKPTIHDYSFRLRQDEYFYPASLVKLPVAALALERLNYMCIEGLDKNTSLHTNPKYSGLYSDTIKVPSLADNIQQMMVVSDNFAFNRVYDFLGQEYSHLQLFQKGYVNTRILHRLSAASGEENRISGPYRFVDSCGNVLYEEEALVTPKLFSSPAKNTKVGKAYIAGRKKINEPKDFSSSNFLPLNDAHQMLISIISPGFIQESSRFYLTESDYLFLRKNMGLYPREAGLRQWMNDSIYYDGFRKYLYFGNNRNPIDSNIRIYNKVGMAYGFMSDVAYFVNYKNKVEFFLSAVIYVNDSEVVNSGHYEYYSIGYPFMERLGKLIYQYELTRNSKCRNKKLSFKHQK